VVGDRQSCLRRSRRNAQDENRITLRVDVRSQDNLAVVHDDTICERDPI
jgi:hypothetical protein